MMQCKACFSTIDNTLICPHCGSSQTDANPGMALPIGTILNGQYQIGRVLGQGGFGITYIAFDINLNRRVAIKEYFPADLAERSRDGLSLSVYQSTGRNAFEFGIEQFLNEAKLLAKFQNHPNIVGVSNFFRENGTAYFVMDYIEGRSIKQILHSQGVLDWASAVSMILPVTVALEAIHAQRMLHRDISPDNIFVTQNGEIKLLDFGAARYAIGENSKSLSVILKAGYAPEEQYRSKGSQGPWTDIYALGATLYRMITGKLPLESIDRLFEDTLLMPGELGMAVPGSIDSILKKAMAVKAEDRYQTVQEFRVDLMRAISCAPLPQHDHPKPPNPIKALFGKLQLNMAKNIKAWAAVCAGAVLVIAAVLLIVLLPRGRQEKQAAAQSPPSEITAAATETSAGITALAYDITGKWGLDYSEKDGVLRDNSMAVAKYEGTYLMLQDGIAIQYKNGEVEWTGTYSGHGTALTISSPSNAMNFTIVSETQMIWDDNGVLRTYSNFRDKAAMQKDKADMDILLLAGKTHKELSEILGDDYPLDDSGMNERVYTHPNIRISNESLGDYSFDYYGDPDVPLYIYTEDKSVNIGGTHVGMSFDEIKAVLGSPSDEYDDYEHETGSELWYLITGNIALCFLSDDYEGTNTSSAQLTVYGGYWN